MNYDSETVDILANPSLLWRTNAEEHNANIAKRYKYIDDNHKAQQN